GAVRSAVGALEAGLGGGPALVVAGEVRTGRPGSPDEAAGGDGASALLVGSSEDGELLAEVIGRASATDEFVDRWRTPGEIASKLWEERFGEGRYVDLGARAWGDALKAAGLVADQVDRVLVATSHARAAATLGKRLGLGDRLAPGLDATVGFTGAAHPGLLLADALDTARAGEVIALVLLADGADAALLRPPEAPARRRPAPRAAHPAAAGAPRAPGLAATVGFTGAAHPGLLLADALDTAGAGEVIALVVLADGADVVLLRTTEALARRRPTPSVADQVAAGAPVAYGTFLAWR